MKKKTEIEDKGYLLLEEKWQKRFMSINNYEKWNIFVYYYPCVYVCVCGMRQALCGEVLERDYW